MDKKAKSSLSDRQKGWVGWSLGFVVVLAISWSVLLIAKIRNPIAALFHPPHRIVLGTAVGDILNQGSQMKVIKVKSKDGLFVEVYGAYEEGRRSLVDRFKLEDQFDAYFHFLKTHTANLYLDDIDGDQKLEIVVPTFDQRLQARMHVFRFNETTKSFEQMTNGPVNP